MATPNLEERKLTLKEARQAGLVSDYAPFRFENASSSQKEFRDAYSYNVGGRNIGVVNNEGLLKAMGAGENTPMPESFYVDAFKTYIDRILSGAQYAYYDEGVKKANEVSKKYFDNFAKMIRNTGQREVGEMKATSKRAMRATGGLLASAASPNLGAGGGAVGPMLGGQSELGGGSTLGMRSIL